MTSNCFNYKRLAMSILLGFSCLTGLTQSDTEKWKIQFAVGLNNPFENESAKGFFSRNLNFPTINLGVQHMFTGSMGAKLDLGYNRSANAEGSPEFKLNYTRINAQFVYDFFDLLTFMPNRINLVGHAGPGVSFTKPLDQFANNTYTFLNFMAGFELHYGISETFSIFGDLGYVYSFSGGGKYDPDVDGLSFDGNLVYATLGVSVALSGCFFCD